MLSDVLLTLPTRHADTAGCPSIDDSGVAEEHDEDVGTENTPPAPSSNLLAPTPPAPPSTAPQMEDGRVLLDTCAMKVKGNWGTDCTKAKRRRRCSSYDPSTRAQNVTSELPSEPSCLEDSVGVKSSPPAPSSTSDFERQQQQESRRVAQAVARFESQQQNLESTILRPQIHDSGKDRDCAGQAATRAKEKITCDLYQLVSPSSRDSSTILTGSSKSDSTGEDITERPPTTTTDHTPDHCTGEKKAVVCERVTGFHVEVVVTGAVDQCVFYSKDSTENVQEETVCIAVPSGANRADVLEEPPPGQLFFLQSPSAEDESDSGISSGICSLDRANKSGSVGNAVERPASPIANVEDCSDKSLCRLYRHVSHDFLEIRFQIQRLLEPRQYMLMLPDHIMVNIFSYLPTRSLAALKCTCHDFKALIETYGVRATDSRWNQDPLYRDDPCKQCKRQYERGDVSLCRWHPKPYHHDLPYGRSYWMCCRRTDKDTPGCRVGLHDNNWVQPCDMVQARTKREDGRLFLHNS
ncbi:hypothetical protein QTP70_006171 [Hemibagrus guttatus]|uniref:F-box domain-containing protein n=1 Tax=Hemibagrus guttatus TaxID=175788 RepID=A0AAE0V210_9TELE|nr:hypothetical protein QTP70_006171 [Hemibagrus guttatus]KAK3560285.1 hypothetical protein QTP86_005734 [Hemibagrus guttatus]